jgi:spoIIIJ-associated protein
VNEKKRSLAGAEARIGEFLEQVIKDAGFELRFQICRGETRHPDFENPETVVKFSGPDVELLLANKAELLLALEQLTMEVLSMPPEEHSLLCFDANDYRMLRIEELRVSALTAADRVKRSGVPFRFNPMNSRERRIIHLALRDETAVRSESSGMGPHRQVVIYPANMPSSPADGRAAAAPRPAPRRGRRR